MKNQRQLKSLLHPLTVAASLAAVVQTASAAVLLTDNFNVVSGNSQNVNEDIALRQTGPLASVTSGFFSSYTGMQYHHQVGNSTTDVGQPGGAANSGYVLIAANGAFQSDLDIPNVSTGPLTIEVDMFNTGANPGGSTDSTEWMAFTLRSAGNTGPVAGAGEFGFLKRANGGVQVFNNGGEITGDVYDYAGAAVDGHWMVTFSDTAGTGSAFVGNGSQVTMTNSSGLVIGPITLSQLSSSGLKLGFTQLGNQFAGIDNLTISGTAPTPPTPPILFHDNFSVGIGENSDNNLNLNVDLGNRQSGSLSPTTYTGNAIHHQVGNDGTDVGQPGGVNNSGYVLTAFNGDFQSDLNIAAVSAGPLTVEFDMYQKGNSGEWLACSLRAPGSSFPIAGTGEFGFLKRQNGGIQAFQNNAEIDPGWDSSGLAPDYHMKLIFTDTAGTGSAFIGNGSQVTLINGTTTLGTLSLSQLNSSGLKLGFNASGNELGGIDNLTISGTAAVIPPTLAADVQPFRSEVTTGGAVTLSVGVNGSAPFSYQWFNQDGAISGATSSNYLFNAVAGTSGYFVIVTNSSGSVTSSVAIVLSATNLVTVSNFSFENGTTSGPGGGTLPKMWTSFNNNNWCAVSSGGYSDIPDGTRFFALNEGPSDPTGGIYQDVGALLPNTTYTLTVALGRNPGFGPGSGLGSPGIISLLEGNNNTGILLASTNGIPDTAGAWQDYSVTFITGPSVTGDLTIELSVAGASTYQANFDNVRLSIAPAPALIAPTLLTDVQPLNQQVTTGAPLTFSVLANGSAPLIYQWYNQNGPISGAINSSYSFNAVAGASDYYVTVTNSSGSVTSSVATVFSATNIVAVKNFSFENGTTSGPGGGTLPAMWIPFNNNNWCAVSSGTYATIPDGTYFYALNEGPSDPTGGIYQDVGALLPNTVYTLTVAIGLNPNFGPASGLGSPGIISLINGTNNAGTLLASTNGIPATAGAWQDYSVTFITGSSVNGDLVVELSVAGASTYQANFDNVRLTTAAAPAVIAPAVVVDINPLRSEVATGAPWSLSVKASGRPLNYQWFDQNGPIRGATGSNYAFNAVSGTSAYYLVITNTAGAVTSSIASVISASNFVTVQNFSFDNGIQTGSGGQAIPVMWSDFNNHNFSIVANNGYSVLNPLAPTADGSWFFAINEGPSDPTGGIFQDVGPLQSNTVYTLTVAIGLSVNFTPGVLGSPGIISLINGTNNTGTVLASASGVPNTPDMWQDYTVSFTNGPAASGDLVVELSVAGASTYQANFDNVRLTTAAAPAVLPAAVVVDVNPLRSEVATGAPWTLSVTASGNPLNYQWYDENGAISGATSASYTFTTAAGVSSYYVIITNSAGAVTSSIASVISATNIVTVKNFSFENGVQTGSGGQSIPLGWSDFNNHNYSTVASNSYSVVNPLAPTADGNDFFAINEGPTDPTGGIFQDVGPLQPNTCYTLTVAVGLREDFAPGNLGSPGIISLINGTSNTGALLSSANGVPGSSDVWQDYTTSFTTGASVSGHLAVELSVAGASTYQANFDNVRLTTAPLVAPIMGGITVAGGNLMVSGAAGTPGASYTVLTTTNLSAPWVWTKSTSGTLDNSGAFSISIPLGNNPASFYRVSVP